MGKYIVEIGRLERLYKASVNGNGKPNMTWLSPKVDLTPYTEPDLGLLAKENFERGYRQRKAEDEKDIEQVKKEAYENGYENGFVDGHLKAEKSGQKFYEDGYKRGLADAWETARTLWNTPNRKEIFGNTTFNTVLTTLTAQEAIEKIRQYEQEKEEIKVGDEVIPRETEYDDMIVTRLWKDDYDSDCIDAIGFDGRISSFLVSRVSKTGKHYEIATVLEKMRGEQDG